MTEQEIKELAKKIMKRSNQLMRLEGQELSEDDKKKCFDRLVKHLRRLYVTN